MSCWRSCHQQDMQRPADAYIKSAYWFFVVRERSKNILLSCFLQRLHLLELAPGEMLPVQAKCAT